MSKEFPLKSKGFNPFGELIGLNFTSCENGHSQCVLKVSAKLMNPQAVLHGGILYTMADTGMGGAVYSDLDESELCATRKITITYFSPVTAGELVCDTKIIRRRSRMAKLESEIFNTGQLVARAAGTFSIFPGTP